MSWLSSPMMVRLDAISASVRTGFSSSPIARSISAVSAPSSSRRARRVCNAPLLMCVLSSGLVGFIHSPENGWLNNTVEAIPNFPGERRRRLLRSL
jgi:hypothetical protein